VVAEAKDLNPRKVRLLRYNVPPLDGVSSGEDPAAEGDLPSALRASIARAVPIDCNRQLPRLLVCRWAGPPLAAWLRRQTPAVGCSLSTFSGACSETRCWPRTEEKVQNLFNRNEIGVTMAIVISWAQ
jgi:hypothetical protein